MSGGGIEAVLAAHRGWDARGGGIIECEGCGWLSERLGPEWNSRKGERHETHVAAAVLAWLDARLAEGDVFEAASRAAEANPLTPTTAALTAVKGVLGGEAS